MNGSLQSDRLETVLPGMLVSSTGRNDYRTNNIIVKITDVEADTRIIGVVRSIPTPESETGGAGTSDSDSAYHSITMYPVRGGSMESAVPRDASDLRPVFEFTPVWVLYDPDPSPEGYGPTPMLKVNAGDLLTSSPIPGFAMVQYTGSSGVGVEHIHTYYSHTVGRAVYSCFPYMSLHNTCIAKGEIHIQPDYLQFKVQRDITDDSIEVYDIYGEFSSNQYVGKSLKAALIYAVV